MQAIMLTAKNNALITSALYVYIGIRLILFIQVAAFCFLKGCLLPPKKPSFAG